MANTRKETGVGVGPTNVPQGNELGALTQRIIKGTAHQIDQIDKSGDPFAEIDKLSPNYQAFVDALTNENYPYYQDKFGSKGEFRKQMALNWLGRTKSFRYFALGMQFTQVNPGDMVDINALGSSVVAVETGRGSYALYGPGSLSGDVLGMYTTIPLRQGVQEIKEPTQGFSLTKNGEPVIPTVGQVLETDGNLKRTSPVIAVFYLTEAARGDMPVEDVMKQFAAELGKATEAVDKKTLRTGTAFGGTRRTVLE